MPDSTNTKENLKLFIEALRSGKYKKTKWKLRINDCFCAKGVACEIFRLNTGIGEWAGFIEKDFIIDYGDYANDNDINWPKQVAEWYGIKRDCAIELASGPEPIENLNDSYDLPFSEMADLIESNFLMEDNDNVN